MKCWLLSEILGILKTLMVNTKLTVINGACEGSTKKMEVVAQ